MMETYNQDPNFSIVMPGGCNAEYPFCFNNNKTKSKSCSEIKFIIGLWERLKSLPKMKSIVLIKTDVEINPKQVKLWIFY